MIHSDIAVETAECTTGAQSTEEFTSRSHESCRVTPSLQPNALLGLDGHSDEIEQLDPYYITVSPTAVIKRKCSEIDVLPPDHKRVCIEGVLVDLEALSLVHANTAGEVSTSKGTEIETLPSLTFGEPTGGHTALEVSTNNVKPPSTSSHVGTLHRSWYTPSRLSLAAVTDTHLPGRSHQRYR